MSICNNDCLQCQYPLCVKDRGSGARRELLKKDQRIITIARRARGWSMDDLADRIYTVKSSVSKYENGHVRAPWDLLYGIMPELEEMRKHGCAYYCDTPHICRIAPCKYARRGRPRKEG